MNELNRSRRELHVALQLAPDYPAAVAAKGAMVAELPRFLGGDTEGSVFCVAPWVSLQTILTYGSCCQTPYTPWANPEEARMHAAVALHIFERAGPPTEVDSVRTLMARLE